MTVTTYSMNRPGGRDNVRCEFCDRQANYWSQNEDGYKPLNAAVCHRSPSHSVKEREFFIAMENIMFDDFLNNGRWFVSRNMSLAVWGEYIPCDSWSGYRRLNDVLSYHIDIYGVHKTNSYGLKPKRWAAQLRYSSLSFQIRSKHHSCKSIKDACQWADKALTEDVFKQACHKFMSHLLATCIVKEDLTPYCTAFGRPQWRTNNYLQSKSLYPYGRYKYARRHGDDTHFAQINIFPTGYGSSGTKEPLFQHWL